MSDNDTDTTENSETYRVATGKHYRDDERFVSGDTFVPTNRELERFSFKFESAPDADASQSQSTSEDGTDSTDSTADTEQVDADAVEDVDEDEVTDEDVDEADVENPLIPDDYERLRSLASAYPGEEINGRSSAADIKRVLDELPDDDLQTLAEAADVTLDEDEDADADN